MTNIERYNNIFKTIFSIDDSLLNDELTVLTVEEWNSVAQMNLVAAVEQEFEIFLDPNDVVDFVSYKNGKDILRRHGVEIWGETYDVAKR